MSKICLLLVVVALLGVAGCSSPSGSREYVPSQGWVPVK